MNTLYLLFLECQDRHESCPVWAEMGECGKNPFYMLAHCHMSCQVCIDGESAFLPFTPFTPCTIE